MPIDQSIAARLNPNKLTGKQVLEKLRECGIDNLDAGLVADCVNVHKACTWQNDEQVSEKAVADANRFLIENKLGIVFEATPSRFGRFIWETTLRHD